MNEPLSAVPVPIKPEYGPTLGRLLAPRWNAAPRLLRALVIAAGVAVVAIAIGAVLTLEPAHYSHGGRLPFSFTYRSLYRTAPEAGGYVRIESHYGDGSLKYSYAVNPLSLPPYTGNISGVLPVYATRYSEGLARRFPQLVMRGQGKTRVNKVPAYQVLYETRLDGREMYGRNVLLLPERPGARVGVEIVMLTAVGATKEVKEPGEVASGGVLLRPLKTFSFG
ncbi:MAG TPA: hypothetical protein VF927_05240 [Solirubrobacteraceae bacterium]